MIEKPERSGAEPERKNRASECGRGLSGGGSAERQTQGNPA